MKHVVNLSGGACSFWAADRVLAKPGIIRDDVTLLFADTLIEDKQLYKFNDWTAEYFGIPITRVSLEMTPWELFRKEGMIGNDRAPICSIRLKREPLWNYIYNTFGGPLYSDVTVYVGFDWTEINRLDELRAEHIGWNIIAPMVEWPPMIDKCVMLFRIRSPRRLDSRRLQAKGSRITTVASVASAQVSAISFTCIMLIDRRSMNGPTKKSLPMKNFAIAASNQSMAVTLRSYATGAAASRNPCRLLRWQPALRRARSFRKTNGAAVAAVRRTERPTRFLLV